MLNPLYSSPVSKSDSAQGSTLMGWTLFLLMHLASLAVFFVGWSWTAVLTALGLYFIRMFAVTGFYHRYFSHRSFKTSRFIQGVFAFLGATAGQQGPIWWAANHRHHHKYSDQPEDLHSPVQNGFWYSHMGWMPKRRLVTTNFNLVPDLTKYPELVWLDKNYLALPSLLGLFTFVLGSFFEFYLPHLETTGFQMLIWGFFISTTFLYHATFTINSLSHQFGSQRYASKDQSRNNFLLALLTLGEGWHNNHHYYATSCPQGFYWWEIDITYYLLWVFSKLGLIWDIKYIPKHLKSQNRI